MGKRCLLFIVCDRIVLGGVRPELQKNTPSVRFSFLSTDLRIKVPLPMVNAAPFSLKQECSEGGRKRPLVARRSQHSLETSMGIDHTSLSYANARGRSLHPPSNGGK